MYHVLSLKSIKLPSINKKYILSRRRLILSKQYREFKEYLSAQCLKVDICPPYFVKIYVESYADIDNGIKMIIDSLKGNCIGDDRDIIKLEVIKKKIKRGKSGRLEVYVTQE
jgi:Holliday junction resolvase RusA-like endonuclease